MYTHVRVHTNAYTVMHVYKQKPMCIRLQPYTRTYTYTYTKRREEPTVAKPERHRLRPQPPLYCRSRECARASVSGFYVLEKCTPTNSGPSLRSWHGLCKMQQEFVGGRRRISMYNLGEGNEDWFSILYFAFIIFWSVYFSFLFFGLFFIIFRV